jgi:hypothetical protein
MKKLLLNCDQVFEVLTRGPFPTGDASDESVEHHLRACHECRQLAEALRPAVAVLHEAVSAEHALDLPEYQGSLPFQRPVMRKLSMVRLALPPRREPVEPVKPAGKPSSRHAQGNSVRLVAATLLVVGLATWLWGLINDSRGARADRMPRQVAEETWSPAREGVPGASGLLTLANLKLPNDCFPLTPRPLSRDQAAELAMAIYDGSLAGLKCCTECHHASQSSVSRGPSAQVAGTMHRHCQACHRG